MLITFQKWILTICFLVHVLFLISIFDIYFTSPIVKGVTPQVNDVPAPAKRLVLFVGDGLRTDSFYEIHDENKTNAQYLRNIIQNRGRWGVSHTRVPTESRPGHVALIAGFYEDPSAIFKGWKDNPIDFDSVFNHSSLTFGWGSPDILSMFNRGPTKSKVIMQAYSSDFEEFSGKEGSATRQSVWAFERFKNFLKEARSDETLYKKLNQDKLIFFLHLLGIDTAGHSHKPQSEEYKNNIIVADNIVRDTELLISQFYNDEETAFIFTSDHGMTDWGSHGEGSVQETETPFVAWGAGILKPQVIQNDNGSPKMWNLSHLQRDDLNQADIAPLMSILLGIPIPVNSIGILPKSILDFSLASTSSALLVNARQIMAQFSRKRELVEMTTLQWLYKPYEELSNGNDTRKLDLLDLLLQKGYYDEVVIGSMDLISLGLTGLQYYHNYYQNLLLFCIALSYIGWLLWLLLHAFIDESILFCESIAVVQSKRRQLLTLDIVFGCVVGFSLILLIAQSLPYRYYLYCCLPSLIWWDVLSKCISYSNVFRNKCSWSIVIILIGVIIGTELVVWSFFERRALSGIICALSIWPLLCERPHFILSIMWISSCLSLMVFPFLPVIGGETTIFYLILSVAIWWLFLVFSCYCLTEINAGILYLNRKRDFLLTCILLGLALYNVVAVSSSRSAKQGLPLLNQSLSWLFLIAVPAMPLFTSRKLIIRLLNIYFSLGVVSLLFSVTHDALFLPLFSFHLFLWLLLENVNRIIHEFKKFGGSVQLSCVKVSRTSRWEPRSLTATDFRRAYFFFFYTVFSFFGIGNVASVNSFDTQWVRCFITLFSPFTMMALILIKLIIPFFITACTFRAVNEMTKVPVDKIFLIVLICCDLLGLNFLFLVKNAGSWLEIGSSVSHYVISQTIILFLVCLYFLSKYFICLKIEAFLFWKFKQT